MNLYLKRIIVSAFMFAVFSTTELFAMAGGGGGFGGGGGGFGGGGGGFGGGGSSFGGGSIGGTLSGKALVIYIICFIVISVVSAILKAKLREKNSYKIINKASSIAYSAHSEVLQGISDRDPDFNLAVFEKRIEKAFRIVQNSWASHNLAPMRAFVSDGIFERFHLQIEEQKALGIKDNIDISSWEKPKIIDSSTDGDFQTLTILVSVVVTDYRVSIKDGSYLNGERNPVNYKECWTLIRRKNTKTLNKDGLFEGNCPNCGASLEMSMHAKCKYCETILRSGQHDWVLSEITHLSRWKQKTDYVPGVHALKRVDKGFCVQNIEDRIGVVFYRYMMTERLNNPQMLTGVVTDECMKNRMAKINKEHPRYYFGDCSIGSAEVKGILNGKEKTKCLVEIAWNSSQFEESIDKKIKKVGGRTNQRREYYILSRKAGVQTDIDEVVSSSHCQKCGAPQEDLSKNECEYCGALFADDKTWLLEEVTPWSHGSIASLKKEIKELDHERVEQHKRIPNLRSTFTQVGQSPRAMECLGWVVSVMMADGIIDKEEEKILLEFSDKYNIEQKDVITMIKDVKINGDTNLIKPLNAKEASYWLMDMVDMAFADHKIDKSEMALLLKVGVTVGLTQYDVNRIIKKTKWQKVRDAKALIKRDKNRSNIIRTK